MDALIVIPIIGLYLLILAFVIGFNLIASVFRWIRRTRLRRYFAEIQPKATYVKYPSVRNNVEFSNFYNNLIDWAKEANITVVNVNHGAIRRFPRRGRTVVLKSPISIDELSSSNLIFLEKSDATLFRLSF